MNLILLFIGLALLIFGAEIIIRGSISLGKKLKVGGYCTEIRRTEVGRFTLEIAKQLESLPEFLTQEDLISPAQVSELLV